MLIERLRGNMAILIIIVAFVASFSLSIYIHMPYPPNKEAIFGDPGFLYTDIVYGVFIPRFLDVVSSAGLIDSKISDYWYNRDALTRLVNGDVNIFTCPAPYKDYKFEYPPMIALLWYFSTCTSFLYTYNFVKVPRNPLEYRSIVSEYVIPMHFAIQVSLTVAFALILVLYMLRMAKIINFDYRRIALLFLLPSTVIYSTYNWDIITVTLVMMSLYYFLNRRYFVSGSLLGLAVSTKIIPILAGLSIGYDLLQKTFAKNSNNHRYDDVTMYLLGLGTTGGIPYAIVATLFSKGFVDFINHHYSWYCENCIYLLFVQNIYSPFHRILFYIMTTLFMLIIMMVSLDYNWKLLSVTFSSLAVGTVLNYVFSPQMMLLLTPLAIAILPQRMLTIYAIADSANALIILLFFEDSTLRAQISKYVSVSTSFSPWTIDSPVQWIAFIRNLLLFIILLDVIAQLIRGSRHGDLS
ncbi:MAG: glycosyltransferase family 87 protein [Ignisphaera sp.]